MVRGIEKFKEWFDGYENQYVIIGGTACDLLMSEEGMDFRATKDLDLVLIVEAITPEFGKRFWEFVRSAGYKHCNKSTGQPQFYRFVEPDDSEFPFMVELFTRKVDAISLPSEAVLTPLPMEEDISSLSAILLDEDYYQLLRSGTTTLDGVTVLDAAHLIPFKAKAWLDLTNRKNAGESVDSKNIRKHKNDVFRLTDLLTQDTKVTVSQTVWADLQAFLSSMQEETVDTKQLGLGRGKESIIADLQQVYEAVEEAGRSRQN